MTTPTARPGFLQFISQEGDYKDARSFGLYAMIYRVGMSSEQWANTLEKMVLQLRTRTGANDTERLAGNEVNASGFTRLVAKEDSRP